MNRLYFLLFAVVVISAAIIYKVIPKTQQSTPSSITETTPVSDSSRQTVSFKVPTSSPAASPSPTPSPSPTAPPPKPAPPTPETVTKKVQVIIFNPTVNLSTGQKLIAYKNWNDPDQLTNQFISDVKTLSKGYLTYQVADKIVVDGFNEKADNFNYTADSYLSCLVSAPNCHQPDAVNYLKILDAYQSCEKRNSGQIDEVWLWGGPYFGYWEAVMTGPNALSTNAPPFVDTKCQKQLNIMGFNYERGVSEMLEDLGHRTEGTLATVFGEDPRFNLGNYSTAWGKFAASDKISPGNAGCGWMHFAPNSQSDYDWSNQRSIESSCNDWLNYPNLSGSKSTISCNTWNCDGYSYKKWWFNHLPKASGKTNGKLNNWWKYVADYENAINQ